MDSDRCSIDVRGGVHDGASARLRANEITIIGSADDCDICLTDAGIAGHHLAIGHNDARFMLRPIDGECILNGKKLRAGDSATLANSDIIELAGSSVCFTIRLITARVARSGTAHRDRRWPRAASWIAITVAAIAVASLPLLRAEPPSPASVTNLDDVVELLQIAGDVDVSTASGVTIARGILPDEKFAAFEAALIGLPADIINRTQSISLLLEQVRSVFRINGYHAELKYAGNGGVEVVNLDIENPQIQEIAVRVKGDVPALAELTFLPLDELRATDRQLAVYSQDPDKRLTTIIDGETAYVATTDGGRYFVGSVLPGGLVLRRITAEGIQVDDNGEIHWLVL